MKRICILIVSFSLLMSCASRMPVAENSKTVPSEKKHSDPGVESKLSPGFESEESLYQGTDGIPEGTRETEPKPIPQKSLEEQFGFDKKNYCIYSYLRLL